MNSAAAKTIYRGGFDDPVLDAQAVFRQIMNALARPGTLCPISDCAEPPKPLVRSVGAIAMTLFDGDTAVWLEPHLSRGGQITEWLRFHTAANIVDHPVNAQFAIVGHPDQLPSLGSFAQGLQEYPDRSTTVIVQVDSFNGKSPLTLTGPGIWASATFSPVGLPHHFCEQWAANRGRFPRGVDILFAAADGVVGLPRTTRIQRADELED